MTYEENQTQVHRLSLNRQAFLLRIWREDGRSPWRILLQSASTGERQTFTNLHTFFAHIETMTACPQATPPQSHD